MQIEDLRRAWQSADSFLARLTKVFIVGCPKSGTTWLMNQLNGHPNMVIRGEGRFAWRLIPMLAEAARAFNADQAKHSSEAAAKLTDIDLLLSARQAIDMILWRYIETSGKRPSGVHAVGDKTPQHSQNLGILNQLYPAARFVSVVRDPRDAAVSAAHHFGAADARPREEYLRHFIQQVWPTAVAGARQSAERLGLGADQFLEIRYEDLHADEHVWLRRVLALIGVDDSDASLDACIAAGSFRTRAGGRDRGTEDAASFYRRGVTKDWVNHIAPELADEMCGPVAGLMTACGYPPLSRDAIAAEAAATSAA